MGISYLLWFLDSLQGVSTQIFSLEKRSEVLHPDSVFWVPIDTWDFSIVGCLKITIDSLSPIKHRWWKLQSDDFQKATIWGLSRRRLQSDDLHDNWWKLQFNSLHNQHRELQSDDSHIFKEPRRRLQEDDLCKALAKETTNWRSLHIRMQISLKPWGIWRNGGSEPKPLARFRWPRLVKIADFYI